MKSNKQRYKEQLSKPSRQSGGSNTGLAIIMTIAIMCIIIALYLFGQGLSGKDDLSIGEGYPIPDAEQIFKHMR